MSKEVKLRIGRNIRYLRESKKLSAEALGDELELSASGVYSYESGRTEPDASMFIRISRYFNVPIDAIIMGDFGKTDPASLLKISRERILFPITVDKTGKENIQMVSIKAKAGYTSGYRDPEYISGLPSFQLPFLTKDRTYRAFQVDGDSMNLKPRDWIIGEILPALHEIRDGNAYYFVTKNDGCFFKVAYKHKSRKKLLLKSLNPAYKPFEFPADDILEAWKFINYFSFELPEPSGDKQKLIYIADRLNEFLGK